jgi:hypothetical protein
MSKEREVDVENFVIKILIFPLSYIDAWSPNLQNVLRKDFKYHWSKHYYCLYSVYMTIL